MSKIEAVDISCLYNNVVNQSPRPYHPRITPSKLSNVKNQLCRADDLCRSLVHENEGLTDELGSLKYKFGETQKCIETFSREKEQIHSDLCELKTLLAETEEGSAREKGKLCQEKTLLSVSLDRLKHETHRVREERDDAEKKMLLLEEVLQIKGQELDCLKKDKRSLLQELVDKESALQKQITTLKKERDDIERTADEAAQNNIFLTVELDKARIQNKTADNLNRTLMENKDKLKNEYQDVCTTFSDMNTEYELYRQEIQKKIQGLEAEIARKSAEMVQIQREKNRAEVVMDDMKKTIAVTEKEKQNLLVEMEVLKETMQKETGEKEAEVAQLIAIGKNKEKMLKQSDSLLTSKEKAMEKMNEELDDYKSELTDVIREKNEMMDKVHMRDVMINDWTSKCNSYETERLELEKRYDKKLRDITQELNSFKLECKDYADENKELQNANHTLSSEMVALRGKLQSLTDNASTLKSDIKEMKENKRKFEVECQILKDHNRNLQVKNAELAKAKDGMIKQNEEMKIAQEETIVKMGHLQTNHAQLAKMKSDADDNVTKLVKDMEQGQHKLKKKEKGFEKAKLALVVELDACKTELKKCKEYLQFAKAEANKERLDRETEIVELKVKMTKKEEEMDDLTSKCQEMEKELTDEKKPKEEAITKEDQAHLMSSCDDIELFRPLDGSTPLPTSQEPVREIELGSEHREMIEKLQTRWTDVMEERKHIKKSMLNFYHLIDILMDGKDKLEKELKSQQEKFDKKLKELKRDTQLEADVETRVEACVVEGADRCGVLEDVPELSENEDPNVMEANLNNILHETNLYEGHIHYLKHQIGLHYSKAEKALDKHKNTMRAVTRMSNGKSLMPGSNLGCTPSEVSSSTCSLNADFGTIMSEHNGYKALADKHFQMINELAALRKQCARLTEEQSRLALQNTYLTASDKGSAISAAHPKPATSVVQPVVSSRLSQSMLSSLPSPATAAAGYRYRDAIDVLKRELEMGN